MRMNTIKAGVSTGEGTLVDAHFQVFISEIAYEEAMLDQEWLLCAVTVVIVLCCCRTIISVVF